MLVIERLERFRVPLLGSLNSLGLVKLRNLFLIGVGQIVFSGRAYWDAA
jgi:hypothetical protein